MKTDHLTYTVGIRGADPLALLPFRGFGEGPGLQGAGDKEHGRDHERLREASKVEVTKTLCDEFKVSLRKIPYEQRLTRVVIDVEAFAEANEADKTVRAKKSHRAHVTQVEYVSKNHALSIADARRLREDKSVKQCETM